MDITYIECCFKCSKKWEWSAEFNTRRSSKTRTRDCHISLTQPKWKQILVWKSSRPNCKRNGKAQRQKWQYSFMICFPCCMIEYIVMLHIISWREALWPCLGEGAFLIMGTKVGPAAFVTWQIDFQLRRHLLGNPVIWGQNFLNSAQCACICIYIYIYIFYSS